MGNCNRRKVSSEACLKEPQMIIWKLRGSWVEVFHDRPEEWESSEDEFETMTEDEQKVPEPAMQQRVESSDSLWSSSDELLVSNSPNSIADKTIETRQEFDAGLVLENQRLGEITENKKTAILTTLRKHSDQLCEGVSIMCLLVLLYSNKVTDSMVFVGIANAAQKSQYLIQEILRAVESDPTKFEAVCRSLSMTHSPAYGQLIWNDYKRELEILDHFEDHR